jgi:glycosyltransferase involved in cell wall biosynthesis
VSDDHAFVVPAFGEPQWLDRCLDSIARQTVRSRVAITTSTPNDDIARSASRRGIPLIINPHRAGIAADWNFALDQGGSRWVTLAHQDDWYSPDYVERCLAAATGATHPLLVFTAATEQFDDQPGVLANTRVKRMLAALAFGPNASIASRFRRRALLSFGNPIPCPSVMINRRAVPDFRFANGWASNLDWHAWVTLAARPGAFVYVRENLVHRTLHAHAATTKSLSDRACEDRRMFNALWPGPIAAVLDRAYAASRNPYRRFGSA